MKITGEKLKAAREDQRVSINEVSMATKISPRMIQAIEEGDVNALPAKTFLRGFVQSYASYLKLDVDDLLEVFHEEMGSTLPEAKQVETSPTVEDREEKKTPPLLHDKGIWPKVIGGGAILALVFIIVGVKNVVEKYEREAATVPPPTDITSLQTDEEKPESAVENNTEPPKQAAGETKKPEPTPEPKPDPVTEPKPEPKPEVAAETKPEEKPEPPKQVAEETKKPEPTPEPEPDPVTEPKPEPVAETKPEPKPTTETKPEPEVASEDQPEPAKPKPAPIVKNEIIVEALDIVEIEFRVGNGDLKRISLKPDQIHTIKAFGPVTLDLSDGGAVNLIHNGRDKGVPGDLGKPKKIKIQ